MRYAVHKPTLVVNLVPFIVGKLAENQLPAHLGHEGNGAVAGTKVAELAYGQYVEYGDPVSTVEVFAVSHRTFGVPYENDQVFDVLTQNKANKTPPLLHPGGRC